MGPTRGTSERVPQLLPQMIAGTRCRNEVAAATSHNHAYRAKIGANLRDPQKLTLPLRHVEFEM